MYDAIVVGARWHGPRRLADWGLLDRVLETNCPAVTSFVTDFGDFPLVGEDLVVDGVPMGVGPRRSRIDGVLVEAAVEAGVELRDGFAVDEFTSDGDRITGIRGRRRGSRTSVTEQAAIVIGADGRSSGRENLMLARLEPLPAQQYALRAALRGNQQDTNQFYLAREGTVPPESFFAPENLQRIMSAGGAPSMSA